MNQVQGDGEWEYYVDVIEEHLLAIGIQLLGSGGRGGREVGQFASARIFDDSAGVGVERVGNAPLDGRHVVFAEPVRLPQVNLQTLFRRETQSAFRFRTPNH